jgi:ArsR family transcriptional regulator, virulence genes transcriptional regulator
MNIDDMQQNAQAASQLLKTLANPSRLMVLCNIVKQERTVGELEKLIGLSQSALSQHLSRLRYEGIVECRREGKSAYYSLKDEGARRVLEVLYGIYCETEIE